MIPRYTRPEMGRIWAPERRFGIWLDVELAACEAMVRLGEVPPEDYAALRKAFDRYEFTAGDVARIDEIEKTVKHDVIAFLTFVEEKGGPAARHLHKGMTSSDVLDTTLAVQLKDATALLLAGMDRVLGAVKKRALEHRRTPIMGRSHGIHAEPTTFGLKVAGWYAEAGRNRERLIRARETVRVGKISGAVGNFAHVDPEIEVEACRALGLEPAPVSTQILQRDRHAELLAALAVAASSLDSFALEIRHLARTEVGEAQEPFGRGQKGSSAMPHKRNPVVAERICGLARVVRAQALVGLENVALWHERDISHSSAERVVFPDSFILTDFLLAEAADIVGNWVVHPDRMRANIDATRGLIYSQSVLLALTKNGLVREEAYQIVQRNSLKAWTEGLDFRALIAADADVTGVLGPQDIDRCFSLTPYLDKIDYIFERVFRHES